MISALPGLLAQTLAGQVTDVAVASGLFAAPCRGETGEARFADGATDAAVFVALGPVSQDDGIGALTAGEHIKLPFHAHVDLVLSGPTAVVLAGTTRDPVDVPIDGADVMLSVVTGHLQTAADAGRNAPISRADARFGNRKLTAEWRFGQIDQIAPDSVDGRSVWRIAAQFEGVQTLSPLPSDGGVITRAELRGQVGETALVATIQGASEQLPLTLFAGIGPTHATRLASFDLVQLRDLMRVPKGEIADLATNIAAGDTDLFDGLTILHALLMLRRDAVLGGLNAGVLFERHAVLTVADVWNGTALTLPDDMRDDQKLRVHFMAGQLMRLIRPEDRANVTLGQMSTLRAEV